MAWGGGEAITLLPPPPPPKECRSVLDQLIVLIVTDHCVYILTAYCLHGSCAMRCVVTRCGGACSPCLIITVYLTVCLLVLQCYPS